MRHPAEGRTNMKLAIHTSAYNASGLPEALRLIADAGYRHVEIAADISETCHFEAHRATGGEVANLAGRLEEYELRLAALDVGGWDAPLCVVNLDESARREAVKHIHHAVNFVHGVVFLFLRL